MKLMEPIPYLIRDLLQNFFVGLEFEVKYNSIRISNFFDTLYYQLTKSSHILYSETIIFVTYKFCVSYSPY